MGFPLCGNSGPLRRLVACRGPQGGPAKYLYALFEQKLKGPEQRSVLTRAVIRLNAASNNVPFRRSEPKLMHHRITEIKEEGLSHKFPGR